MLKIFRRSGPKVIPQKRCGNCSAPFGRRDKYCRVCGARRGEDIYDPSEDIRRVGCVYGPPPDLRSFEPDRPGDTIRVPDSNVTCQPGDTIRVTDSNVTCQPGDTIRMPNADAACQSGDTIRITSLNDFPPTARD